MTTYGLTSVGFVRKTVEIIHDEIDSALRAAFGTSIDLSTGTIEGQLAAIVAEREGLVWEIAEQIYNSQDPNAATGAALDNLSLLTGTFRGAASPSTVTLTLTGTAATVVLLGSQASALSTGTKFKTLADATLVELVAWAGTTAYVVGDRRKNASRSYICITAGTSAGSGGPTTTSSAITDSGAVWRYMGEGTAVVDVSAECTVNGPLTALADDISVIETPVGGWSNVRNLLDATPGTDTMSDQGLRLLRAAELSYRGGSPVLAISARVLQVADVTSCTVFYNNSNITDADGVPAHSVEVMVRGGVDVDIATALFASVAGGIGYKGTTTVTLQDTQGFDHTIKFSRPTEVPVWVIINIDTDALTFPADGATAGGQIELAVVAWGDAIASGDNVRASRVGANAFTVPGVLDVTSTLIGLSNPPTVSTTMVITSRQLATFDSSRIVVNATPVSL